MGQKRCYFEKQSGEVAENKGKGYIDSQKRTGKQSGEVVENTYLWKKQTGTKLKTKRAMLLKIQDGKNTSRKRTETKAEQIRVALHGVSSWPSA